MAAIGSISFLQQRFLRRDRRVENSCWPAIRRSKDVLANHRLTELDVARGDAFPAVALFGTPLGALTQLLDRVRVPPHVAQQVSKLLRISPVETCIAEDLAVALVVARQDCVPGGHLLDQHRMSSTDGGGQDKHAGVARQLLISLTELVPREDRIGGSLSAQPSFVFPPLRRIPHHPPPGRNPSQ